MIITKVTKLKREGSYGYTLGNQSLQLTSRDSAKIGYLYLNDGRWGKKQILSPEWVSEATRTQIDVPGKDWDYGYLWWTSRIGGHRMFIASGAGGQRIYGIPDLDILMVTTGGSDVDYGNFIEKFVIPAALK